MGGLALRHLSVRRVDAEEHRSIAERVQTTCTQLFNVLPMLVMCYSSKRTFGDCDFLMVEEGLPSNWYERLATLFNSRGFKKCSDSVSIEVQGVQVNFITVAKPNLKYAYTYYQFNGLGKLMSMMAASMGFCYTPHGFYYPILDTTGKHVSHVRIDCHVRDIFEFLDLDYGRYLQGFSNVVEILEYLKTSAYFDTRIYLDRRAGRIRGVSYNLYRELIAYYSDRPPIVSTINMEQCIISARTRWPGLDATLTARNHVEPRDQRPWSPRYAK